MYSRLTLTLSCRTVNYLLKLTAYLNFKFKNMANLASSKKAIRVTRRKTAINKRKRRSYKEARKAVKDAVAAKEDKKTIKTLLDKAYKAIDKAAKRNIIHKKTAARNKSKLAKLANSTAK